MTVLVCMCEVVKRGVLSMLFMIPPVVLVAVAGSDNKGANDTSVDNRPFYSCALSCLAIE